MKIKDLFDNIGLFFMTIKIFANRLVFGENVLQVEYCYVDDELC